MSIKATSSSSFPQFGSSNFEKIRKGSLVDTIKKTAAVTGIVLGGASLITGVVLISVATGGIAIPIAIPFVLGGIGATGVTSGCCGLDYIRVNRVANKVLKAANQIREETENLEQTYAKQGAITTDLAKKLENLNTQTNKLAEKLGNGDQRLKEVDQKIEQTKKQKKEFERDVETLTNSLHNALKKLQALPTSDREMKAIGELIGKMGKKLDKFNKNFLRVEQQVREHNQSVQQLRFSLFLLQKNQVLKDLKPSSELEKIATAIRNEK